MERTFALIRGTYVENHIVANENFIDFIKDQYEYIIETTDLMQKPSPGWYMLEDQTFVHQNQVIESINEIIEEPIIEQPVTE